MASCMSCSATPAPRAAAAKGVPQQMWRHRVGQAMPACRAMRRPTPKAQCAAADGRGQVDDVTVTVSSSPRRSPRSASSHKSARSGAAQCCDPPLQPERGGEFQPLLGTRFHLAVGRHEQGVDFTETAAD